MNLVSAVAGLALHAGPAGTWVVEVDGGAYTFTPAGELVDVGPGAALPSPARPDATTWAVADGGGNHAVLGPAGLDVTGTHPCHVDAPVDTPVVLSDWAPTSPVGAPSGPFQLAVDETRLVVLDHEGVLLVDLPRCRPVAALGHDDTWTGVPALLGDELVVVERKQGLRFRHARLPDLAREDDVVVQLRGLYAGTTGLTLVTTPGFRTPERWLPFGDVAALDVTERSVQTLDQDGRVRVYDRDGALVSTSEAGAASDSFAAPGQTTAGLRVGDPHHPIVLAGPPVPWTAVRYGAGLVATRGDVEAGVAIRPTGRSLGAVSPDGRVLVTDEAGALTAWRVADGGRVWSVPLAAKGPAAMVVGPSWVALADGDGWLLFDAADGARLGRLDAYGGWVAGGRHQRLDPAHLGSAAWSAPVPTSRPRRGDLPEGADPGAVRTAGCADPEVALAPLRGLPHAFDAAREQLAACPVPAAPVAPGAVATATAGASWAWTAPEVLTDLQPLGQGRVFWRTKSELGVLGPDGALLWWSPSGGNGSVADGVVFDWGKGRGRGLDAATGAVLWSRALSSPALPATDTPTGEPRHFDVRTGRFDHAPTAGPGMAWGWYCAGGTCARERPNLVSGEPGDVAVDRSAGLLVLHDGRPVAEVPDFQAPRTMREGFVARRRQDTTWAWFDSTGKLRRELGPAGHAVVDGRADWEATGDRIVAHGVSAPAKSTTPTAVPGFVEAPLSALPAALPLPELPPPPPAPPTGDRPSLHDGRDGAVCRDRTHTLWIAPGRWKVGEVGEVAIVRDPLGAYEGRATADGRVLWTRALERATVTAGALRRMVDDPGTHRPRTVLVDETTGRDVPLAGALVSCLAADGTRVCVVEEDGRRFSLVDAAGRVLGPLPSADVRRVRTVGTTTFVLLPAELLALRGGRQAWDRQFVPSGELSPAGPFFVLRAGPQLWYFDGDSGAVVDIVSAAP